MIWRSENKNEEIVGVLLVAAGVLSRLLPHFENFSPVMAIALFSGVVLSRRVALTVPLLIMMISDIFKGFHSLMPLTWALFSLMALWGLYLKRNPDAGKLFFSAAGGSVLFFIGSNLGVFFVDRMYPMTGEGLLRCFTLALPFFRNSFLGDLFYAAVLFGLFALAKRSVLSSSRSS